MPSLTWVDFSSADRDRMGRAIALFQERETRDELGLSTIRDGFAEALFPGTSTIQTRLRYFLFIPWIYQRHESKRTGAEQVSARARVDELALVEPLLASDDTAGTIGRVARESLMRLPSSVYWAGMQRWQIFLPRVSLDAYHRDFDALRRRRSNQLTPEDDGVTNEPHTTWHPRLPAPPADFPNCASFALTRAEAEFLRGRITAHCEGSALAYFADHGTRTEVGAPWDYPNQSAMAPELKAVIDLSRRFSLVFHGAALLYNLMLSEQKQRGDWIEGYTDALDDWATQTEASDLCTFSTESLWDAMTKARAVVPSSTMRFVDAWAELLGQSDPAAISSNDAARRLVKDRERRIKGARSRFMNRRALDQWGGSSGTARIVYRWNVVQTLLNDLHAGIANTN